jgi:hypothetical protein
MTHDQAHDEEQFDGGWLHTEVGRQVRPVVRVPLRARAWRRLLALRARLRRS